MTNKLTGTNQPFERNRSKDNDLSEFGEGLQDIESVLGLDDWSIQDFDESDFRPPTEPQSSAHSGVAALWAGALVSVIGAGGLIWHMMGSDNAPDTKNPVVLNPKTSAIVSPDVAQPVSAALAVAASAAVPASASASASAPATEAEAVPAAAMVPDESDSARDLIEHWRQAWVARDVSAYLGFYSPNFLPPRGQSLADWKAARRKALSRPAGIEIKITALRIERLTDDQVKVVFLQDYSSGSYREVAQPKTLLLVRSGSQWQIAGEWQGTTDVPVAR